mmetsp:Transcript_62784/g.162894  ORF Transcript_62784/g.162894 Transcript_62784/m.162894 type:complete len:396 (+) Transcript_62784:438-1625(+)
MRLAEARAINVVQILLERMEQQVKLVPRAKEGPILVGEICKKRLTIAQIANVFNFEDLDVIGIDLHLFVLISTLLFWFLLVLLRSVFLLDITLGLVLHRFPPDGILPLTLDSTPVLVELLPLRPLILEPIARLQILCSLCQLLLQHPILQMLRARLFALPHVRDTVEAFLFRRQGEIRKVLCEDSVRNIREVSLPIIGFLLLLSELNLLILLLLLGLCLLLLLLLVLLLAILFVLAFLHLLVLLRLLGLSIFALLCFLLFSLFCLLRLLLLLYFLLGRVAHGLVVLSLLLLLLQHQAVDIGLVLLVRLAHYHIRGPLEVGGRKFLQDLFPLGGQQVRGELGDEVVPLDGGSDATEQVSARVVVQHGDAKPHVRLIAGGCAALGLGPPQSALLGPL